MSTQFTRQDYINATLDSSAFFEVVDTYPEINWADRCEIARQMFDAYTLEDIEHAISAQTWLNWTRLSPNFESWPFTKKQALYADLTPVILHYYAEAQKNNMFSPIEGVMLYFLENTSQISFVLRHNDNV